MESEFVRLLSFAVVGAWAAWCVSVLRDDLRIKEAKAWRWFRAVFLSILFILFLAGAAILYFKGFVTCFVSFAAVVALAEFRRGKNDSR